MVIVGGGMAGLTLALLLRRHGFDDITVLEAAELRGTDPDTPSFDARSTALSEGGLEILARAGIAERLGERAEPIRQVHVSRQGRPGVMRMSAADQGVERLGVVVENRWFGHALLEAVRADQAIRLLSPVQLTSLERHLGGYRARLDDGTELDAGLLVAADGARSRTRALLGISAHTEDSGEDALIANVSMDAPHEGIARERFVDEGPLALLPLTGQRMTLVWTGPRQWIPELEALSDEALARRVEERFAGRVGTITHIGRRHRYPLVLTRACAQAVPHAVVVGNAAHALHPVAAQGFNLTLRDLVSLAETLEGAEHPGELRRLDAWYQARQGDQAMIDRFSGGLSALFRTEFPPAAHARQLGLMALDALAPARRAFARRAMGLHWRRS